MSPRKVELPDLERTDRPDFEDAAEVASRDSEVDFDDEREDDQRTLDVVEAIEVGVLLDDPETLSADDDEGEES
jgi:hypothetical protein